MKQILLLLALLGVTTIASAADLTGSVTADANDSPLSGIEVSLYAPDGDGWAYSAFTNTDPQGDYIFTGLADGEYRLLFRDWSGEYAFQYWPNGATIEDGQTIVINDASQTIDASMQIGGRIAGTLSDPAGRPLFNPLISVFGAWAPNQVLFVQQPDGTDYAIGGLPTGDYLVRFTGQQSNNRSYLEYYDDASNPQSATTVSVQVGDTTDNIDAVMGLGPGGTIRGRLRDRYGEELDIGRAIAMQWNDGQWIEVSSADALYQDDDFDYLLDVPAGTYRLRFDGGSFLAPNGELETEFYDDAPIIDSAVDITVQTGDELRDIDVRLGTFAAASLSGTLTDTQGNPAVGIEVLVFDRALRFLSDQIATSDANGDYSVTGLWPEEYFVRFYDPTGNYANVYYSDAQSPSDAQRVPVAGVVEDIDAVLDPAPASAPGSIAGQVTTELGQPLAEVTVRAYEAPCDFSNDVPVCDTVSRTETAADGRYRLRDLASGDYLVQFVSPDGDYLTRFYAGADGLGTATPVAVTAPTATTGIDASLPLAGAISGVVTNAFGDAFNLLSASAYRLIDGEYVFERFTFEQDDTEYRIAPLPTGTYRVGFSGGGWSGPRETGFYDDAPDLASATEVTVTAGSETAMIDAILGTVPGGAISGTVTDGSGTPAAGITVKLYDGDFLDDQVLTDAAGRYEFSPLNPGVYFVEFVDSGGTLPGEWYLDVASFDRATPVVVEDAVVNGIDAELDGAQSTVGGGLISGTISDASGAPLEGIQVSCQPAEPFSFFDLPCFGTTDSAGEYAVGGRLLANDYELVFRDPGGVYATEYFDDRIFRTDADPVPVAVGAETASIDAELTLGASIEGTVTRAGGGFYPITLVSLLRQDPVSGDWLFVQSSAQLDDGNYRIDGVSAGTYRVRFRGSSLSGVQNADVEFYDNVADLVDAADVELVAGQVTSGIDAMLGDLDAEGRAANADFDEGLAGWTISNSGAVEFAEDDIHASPHSGSLAVAAEASVAVSQCVAIDGIQAVEAIAYHRSAAAAEVELWLTSYEHAACTGSPLNETEVAGGLAASNWERLQGGLTTPAGTTTVRIELRVTAATEPVHADGIDLRLAQPTGEIFVDGFE